MVCVMGTQMSKTTSFLNVIGRKLDDDPAPVLYIGPTKSNLESIAEPQISAMLRSVPSLRAKMPGGKAQKKLVKRVAGVTLRLVWAGSATELASQPAHTVIVDERDKMMAIKGEGDPETLATARIATYPDGKIFIASSPTEGTVQTYVHPDTGFEHWQLTDPQDIPSAIWRDWQEGTRHEWAVPCQHCHEFFIPRFKLLKWPDGATPRSALKDARLACPKCGGLHEESSKEALNAKGKPVAPGQRIVDGEVVGEIPGNDTASLWVSGLMSPWVSFGQRAAAWIRAAASGNQDRIRAEINTSFGELYQLRGQAPDWKAVQELGAGYKLGDIPRGVIVIFLTVDVQKDHLVCVVRAWGVELESWLIHCEELWGDTDQPEVWERLTALSEKQFSGKAIAAVAVDSGYRTERAYQWCHERGAHSYATFGRDRPAKLYASFDVEVNRLGRRLFSGMKRWILDESYFKGWVHDRLNWPQEQPGAWHLPSDVPADYCRQLVGEQRMRLPSGGVQWVKSGANDYLDCEKQQVFLAHVEGVRNMKLDAKKRSISELARGLNAD